MEQLKLISEVGTGVLMTSLVAWMVYYNTVQIKPLLTKYNELISNSTKATEAVSESVKLLSSVVEKVSDKLVGHDERSIGNQKILFDICSGVNDIRKEQIADATIVRIHNRLDVMPDKQDYAVLHQAIRAIAEDIAIVRNKVGEEPCKK